VAPDIADTGIAPTVRESTAVALSVAVPELCVMFPDDVMDVALTPLSDAVADAPLCVMLPAVRVTPPAVKVRLPALSVTFPAVDNEETVVDRSVELPDVWLIFPAAFTAVSVPSDVMFGCAAVVNVPPIKGAETDPVVVRLVADMSVKEAVPVAEIVPEEIEFAVIESAVTPPVNAVLPEVAVTFWNTSEMGLPFTVKLVVEMDVAEISTASTFFT
jgi:hypothetical protein